MCDILRIQTIDYFANFFIMISYSQLVFLICALKKNAYSFDAMADNWPSRTD